MLEHLLTMQERADRKLYQPRARSTAPADWALHTQEGRPQGLRLRKPLVATVIMDRQV